MAQADPVVQPLADLMESEERKLERATLDAFDRIRQLRTESEVVAANNVVDLYPQEEVEDAFSPVEAAVAASVIAGAALVASQQKPVESLSTGATASVVFNPANPDVTRFAEEIAATRIRELTNDVRAVISITARESAIGNYSRQAAAQRILEVIGLTSAQERAVQNFRNSLENRSAEALRRTLRDRRFDPSLIRSIDLDEPLSSAQVSRMVSRYRDRLRRYRANVIARSEVVRAANGGAYHFIESQVRTGKISEDQVRRFWHYIPDARVREAHSAVPSMNPGGVGPREAFQTPLGPLRFPGDPRGTASNTINCRCAISYQIIDAKLLAVS